jgi:hypothetical protein
MAFTDTVRSLARRFRPAASAAKAAGPVRLTTRVVNDYDVAPEYPGHVLRPAGAFRWTEGPPGEARMLTVFPVDGAIVTMRYIVVDPVRGYLLVNQSYETLPISTAFAPGAVGQSFAFEVEAVEELAGPVVVIGGPFEFNYYHGLLNWFSRFAILEMLAPGLLADPSVRFLVDEQGRREPFRSILAALAIAPERIIWANHERNYRIERAWVVSFLHEGIICPEVYRAYAARILGTLGIERKARGTRRVWISREHLPEARRRIDNFAELAPALASHGFEIVRLEELGFAEQARLFADAEIVTGSHGAGFSNIIFCPPAAKLLVIEKDFARMLGISNLFSSLGTTHGLDVEIVPATSIRPDGIDWSVFVNCHFADARVDAADYVAALDRVVRSSEAA